jgi:two-component system, OmpR family, response regulator
MRILLVDDEERFIDAVAQGLQAEGFVVDVARDGRDGLAMAGCGDYDAIVLDLMLPGMNGYMVCSELRSGGNWVPIIMLTAMDGELDEAEGLDCGADDYLTKPFSFVVLLARLRALLRRGAPPRPAVLTVGELTLDPATHRCWLRGAEVRLTVREFALLEYLMRRPGQVTSKSQILEHVWDFAWAETTNVVEVYMGYLRKKLANGSGSGIIETVRGRGYRLVGTDSR